MIVVDGVTLPAKSHAWGLMHVVLHPNKIYKYSRSPPQKSEVLIKQT